MNINIVDAFLWRGEHRLYIEKSMPGQTVELKSLVVTANQFSECASVYVVFLCNSFNNLKFDNGNKKDSDQTARMGRLICVFVGRTFKKARFLR